MAVDTQHRVGGVTYVVTLLVLLGLTAISFGLSWVPLGAFGPVIALVIATVKAVLVLMVFMHLLDEPFSVRVVALVALIFIVLLCLGIAADVLTR